MLNEEELQRYSRQIAIAGFGVEAQEKLRDASVLIAGAGGLGNPVTCYLASAGIGRICLIDSDTISLSNLNRQVLYWRDDVGKIKVECAAEKLRRFNPDIEIETVCEKISGQSFYDVSKGYDIIVDAVDSMETRYILNDAAIRHSVPLVHGAISGFEGRVTTVIPGKTACLMCLYQGIPVEYQKEPVLGATAAIIGSVQATEVIKYITGMGTLLENTLLVYNGLTMEFIRLTITRNSECPVCSGK